MHARAARYRLRPTRRASCHSALQDDGRGHARRDHPETEGRRVAESARSAAVLAASGGGAALFARAVRGARQPKRRRALFRCADYPAAIRWQGGHNVEAYARGAFTAGCGVLRARACSSEARHDGDAFHGAALGWRSATANASTTLPWRNRPTDGPVGPQEPRRRGDDGVHHAGRGGQGCGVVRAGQHRRRQLAPVSAASTQSNRHVAGEKGECAHSAHIYICFCTAFTLPTPLPDALRSAPSPPRTSTNTWCCMRSKT